MNYAGKFDAATSLVGQGSSSPAFADSFTAKPFIAKAHGHVPDGAFVVPDPNLIFNGEFKRAGLDLVLSHDGHEFVVHDYFRGDKRAALASPDGAHLSGDVVNALTGHVQVAQAAPGTGAGQVIGHVTKLVGSATAIRNGVSVILNNGDNVEKGDVVSTGSDSTLGITFIDGTVFGLSSNARMVLNEMVYDPNGSNNSSLLSLVAGTITFVAGETAKRGDMKVDTPVATMGIRGTAVLTQINFVVPAGGGDPQPQASFQVLVEPNGTTGSYILFDKVTLLPIATVNQAGQMIQISGGNVSITNALMSPEVQKLITDVFTLKFTDNNTNTKLTTNYTDTITPFGYEVLLKSASGATVTATFVNLNPQGSEKPTTSTPPIVRIPGQPIVQSFDATGNVKTAFGLTERAGTTGDTQADTISGIIRFVDQNLGDLPTVSVSLAEAPNYVYKNAGQQDVTGSLTALQKQDIAATQIQISVVADPANNNNGSAVWTYTIPDHVFDFLAAGETLTLTYMVRVDTNFAVNPESKFIPITITITGTNDKPTVATSGGTVIEQVGTGNEALDVITGTVTFTDVDLTDRPIVSAELSSTQPFKYLDAEGNDITATLTPAQLAAISAVKVPLTVVQGAGNGNNGTATWTYSVPDHLFDFLAEDEKLILNYVVQVDDGHGGVVSTPLTVSINGADVNVEGTNDLPTIVEDETIVTGAVTEDTAATLTANGTIAFNDPDLTDTHTASYVLKSTTSNAHLPGFGNGTSHIGTFALTAVSESPGVSTRGSVGWTFTLNDNDPVLQSLAEGQTITQVYTVTVDDHHGGTVTRDVTVTITGTNDTPTITSDADAAKGSVTEDACATLSIEGTLAIQDLDLIDTHTAQAAFKSAASNAHLPGFDGSEPLGTFTIDTDVSEFSTDTINVATLGWHFSLDNNNAVLQSLAKGQTITQVYTVTFTDDHGAQVSQDVTVTINGANDAPTITSSAADAAGAVTEHSATLSIEDTLAIQDVDLIDTHTAEAVFKSATSNAHLPGFDGNTPLGTFTIDCEVAEFNTDTDNSATLGWHFSLDNDNAVLQSLAHGQTITQVYTVTFTDDHGAQVSQDVTVTINGANDAPTITSDPEAATGAVTEDDCASLTTSGTLAIQDVDLIDTHTAQVQFKSSSVSSTLPGFEDDSTNIGTFSIGAVSESNADTSNGATLDWHFTLNNSDPVLQSLAEGQTITQVYTVTFKDNHNTTVTQDVTVTITGTNDAPTVSYVTSDYMNFDGATIAVGDVPTVATDDVTLDGWVNWNGDAASASQVLFYNGNTSTTGFGLMGTVISGKLEIAILEGGVEIQDTGFALTAGQWHNLALTRDDGIFTLYVDGNVVYSHSGGVNAIAGAQEPSYMMIGAASGRYAPGFGTQGFTGSIADVSVWTTALTQAQIQSYDFTALTGNEANLAAYYTFGDGSGSTASNTVNPTKSLAIEGDADWASGTSGPGGAFADLMETNGGQLSHGVLAVSDVDATDHVTVSVDAVQVKLDNVLQTGSVGGLSHADLLNYLTVPSGDILNGTATHAQFTWQFNSAGQAFDFLAAGQTLSLQYTIVPSDAQGFGTSAVVTINVTGTNDAPTLSDLHIGPLTDTADDDTFSNLTGQLAGTDADSGETATLAYAVLNSDHQAATTVAGLYGSLTVNSNGSYSYVPNDAAINALADGSYVDTFTLQTTDIHGATNTATLKVNVTGADDGAGPVINTESFQVEHIIENSNEIITDLMITDTDPGAATDTFTVTLSTANPDVSLASVYPTTGTLEQINTALAQGAGIVYEPTGADPEAELPATDQITLTIADSAGRSDTVNFIFVEGAESQGMTLQGTAGKDVIFATESSDTLIGGSAKDQFVFAPASSQDSVQHTVNDFEYGLDKIDLRQFSGIGSLNDLAPTAAQDGGTLLTLDSHETILLKGVAVANLQSSDFIFGTHVG
ncbi:VCBS domain-containing protein [Bradyrhizobium yuanmingense]|uniref:VCBS domain-containing protein n=1 Tax=Bradyrhizobium yuanmingense TaxID=108015 RepID=UPI0023B98DF7|nr:VCBS domain-containing protein [Bradyrhizobium yuanmingense]MDF0582650.1 VCBS domain-containing protein [Bradyrhizobium yuanmingense]